jgi:ATP-dependent helicase HrpA
MPISDTAEIIAREIQPQETSLSEALARFVKQRFRVDIPASVWAQVELPKHLKMRVSITDHSGRELAAGRDLDALRRIRREAIMSAAQNDDVWAKARQKWERTGITAWDFGTLPEMMSIGPGAIAYPGLETAENGANLRLFKTEEEALASHKRGVQALLLLKFAKDLKFMERYLVLPEEYQKTALYFGGKAAFEKMLLERLKAEVFQKNLRSEEEFKAYAETVVRQLFEKAHALWEVTRPIFVAYQEIHVAVYAIEKTSSSNRVVSGVCSQIRKDIEGLVPKNFLELYGMERLSHLPRYLNALRLRAERAKNDPEKDRSKSAQAEAFVKALEKMQTTIKPQILVEKKEAIQEFRWMVEEFKVALFAPELKTAFPISPQRLARKKKEIDGMGSKIA